MLASLFVAGGVIPGAATVTEVAQVFVGRYTAPSGTTTASSLKIEGAPPEQTRLPVGCPFAPRCAWRLPVCWTVNPPLAPEDVKATIATTGPAATHLFACHNPATAEEAEAGMPLRPGFRAAPRPEAAPEPPTVAA